MILYFSGTGNSRFVATKLSAILKDELTDIGHYVKNDIEGRFSSSSPYIFVLPTYASYIPLFVEKFIMSSQFDGNKDTYIIMTCGASASRMGIAKRLSPILAQKRLNYKGIEQVIMPENYITLFIAPPDFLAKKLIKTATEKVNKIGQKIIEKKNLFMRAFPTITTFLTNKIFYKILTKDKPYYTTDKCISCGICVANCPLNNIKMEDNRPKWQGNCTQCMRCIATCPRQAIEYGCFTKFKKRYYLETPTDTACDTSTEPPTTTST